jgi:hypothetical protein
VPHKLPVTIAALQHPVHQPRRLDHRVGAVPLDQQIGGAIDVEVGDHLPAPPLR